MVEDTSVPAMNGDAITTWSDASSAAKRAASRRTMQGIVDSCADIDDEVSEEELRAMLCALWDIADCGILHR